MYFLSENFYFDDISNRNMEVELITFDNDLFYQMGTSYQETIERQDSSQSMPFYTSKINDSTEDVVLKMLLVDEDGNPKVWDEMKIEEIMDWLITDDFKPFVSEDNLEMVYYFKASKIVKFFTCEGTGYLEVTFKPYSNYCYIRTEISTSNLLNITNPSNLEGYYKPVMKITANNGEEVTITNETTKETFTIGNVSEEVIVDNLYRTVQTTTGKNKLSSCNRGWISLSRGLNKIKVIGGTVKFICEFPIIR